jgi:hypothetical protein
MNMTITLNMDNASFEDPNLEVSRILRHLAECLALSDSYIKFGERRSLLDANGNEVGTMEVA